MLNKARKKFILWSMVLSIAIVLVLIAVINLMNWNHVDTSLENAINEIAISHGGDKKAEQEKFEGKFALMETAENGEIIISGSSADAAGNEMADSGETAADSGSEDNLGTAESAEVEMKAGEIISPEPEAGTDIYPGEKNTNEYSSTDDSGKGEKGGKDKGNRDSADVQYGSRYFIVHVHKDGSVDGIIQNQDTVTADQAYELMSTARASNQSEGYLDRYRYLMMNTETAVFLDCSTDLAYVSSLLLTSILVGFLGILIAFAVIIMISKKIVEPVRISIEKQKQFTTNAGHGLKTPLAAITMNMDIIAMELEDNEWVEGTQKQIKKLCKLVENLIALSKIDEDESQAEKMLFSITDVANECVESFRSIACLKGKEMSADIEEGLMITGDPGFCHQIISILCDNAMKYSSGPDPVEIKLKKEGKFVVFETANEWNRDIDIDKLNRLFERFYRGDTSRNSDNKPEGYGVGLSMAKAMAEKNKAMLTVSTDHRGWIVFRIQMKIH